MGLPGKPTAIPSGQDSLDVRRAYFRSCRASRLGNWRRVAVAVLLGAMICWLCLASLAILIRGSS